MSEEEAIERQAATRQFVDANPILFTVTDNGGIRFTAEGRAAWDSGEPIEVMCSDGIVRTMRKL